MTDIMIKGKIFRNIELLTEGKLDHLIQLIDVEITNYKNYSKNYSPEKQKKVSIPFLNKLNIKKEQIIKLKEKKFSINSEQRKDNANT